MSTHLTDGQVSATKAGGAWAMTGFAMWLEAIGINSWGDLAAMLAALYSLILIGEWCWKKYQARKQA
jgi:hypothetical protein